MSDHGARGRGHVTLSRHKLGSWNTLVDFLNKETCNKNDEGSSSEQKDDGNSNIYVSRLDQNYMGLYGLFPETDRFSAVVCDCGSIVKPQGFKNHLARNHSSANGVSRGSKSDLSYYTNYSGGLTSSSSSNNGSSSRSGRDKDNNYSSSNSPASSTSSTPVKNPEDFSGILPNSNTIVKHKHKHKSSDSGKSKYKSKGTAAINTLQQQHSSDSQPGVSEKLPDFLVNATSTSLDSSSYTFSSTVSGKSGNGVGATTTLVPSNSVKSQSKGRHRHSKHDKAKKGELYDPDKHCGVVCHSLDDGNKPCLRSFSCKVHSVQQRRDVQGRTRNFDTLLLEMGQQSEIISIDLESNSSSCSSVLEKQSEPILTEEAAMRIKEQIELPTILLRKLEHDVVQGMDNRTIAELLEKNAIVMKKDEPMQIHETITMMDTSADVNPDQMPPQELFELISQVEEQAVPEQNILTMEQLTNLVENTNKNQVDMFQLGTEVQQLHTELHCRTIAFPLSVFYLMKNNLLSSNSTNNYVNQSLEQRSDLKFANTLQTLDPFSRQQTLSHQVAEQIGQYYDPINNQIHSDFNCDLGLNANQTDVQGFHSKPTHDLLSNILNLQELVPLVPDNYCDVYSKVCDQNFLSDCSPLFPMLTNVHENESINNINDKQYDIGDYRSIKSCLYQNLPKPVTVNTFGLKRVGGGSTISRKALYLRKTLLKTKESDKKFKLKTEASNYANTNVQSPHGMLLTSSAAVNKGRKRSFLASTALAKQKNLESSLTNADMISVLNTGNTGHRLGNAFTNDTSNKMDIDSNLEELLQPKRQLFASRY